jgi:hypothetical protein
LPVAPGCAKAAARDLVYRGVPRQQPPIQQAEPRHACPLDGFHALGRREHRGVHPQSRVPKQADHLGQPFLEFVGPPCRFEQKHDVHLGEGKGPAQSVGAAGQHRQRFREERQNRRPVGLGHQLIDSQRERVQCRLGLPSRQEFLFDCPPRVGGLEFLWTPGRGTGPAIQSFLHTSSITQPVRAPASVFSLWAGSKLSMAAGDDSCARDPNLPPAEQAKAAPKTTDRYPQKSPQWLG